MEYGPRYRHGGYSGGKETAEHYVWRTMVARCTRPSAKDFARYGGRGVNVCDRWMQFDNFLADMGGRPSGMSLDRVNNDGPYCKENCRWATRSEQQTNKRSTRYYFNGYIAMTLVEAAQSLGISKELAHWRFKHWGTFERHQRWQELQKGL